MTPLVIPAKVGIHLVVLLRKHRPAGKVSWIPDQVREDGCRTRKRQAQIEGLTLVSNEKLFDAFDVERLWWGAAGQDAFAANAGKALFSSFNDTGIRVPTKMRLARIH